MNNIKLEAKNSNEKIILEYLKNHISSDLAERINSGTKTLAQCWAYILSEAKKLAKSGCACVEDSKVYGWCTHFFEEDGIKGEEFSNSPAEEVVTSKKVEAHATVTVAQNKKSAKSSTPQLDQISFDALLG